MALDLPVLLQGLTFRVAGAPAPPQVAEIRTHSSRVQRGDLFVAIPGRRHNGVAFAGEAVRRGARVIVAEQPPPGPLPPGVTWIQVPDARAALSRLAANRYGHPAGRLLVVGITGTTGKTTTALLLHHLLKAAGWRAGLVGSLEVDTGRRRFTGRLTTPDPLELHGYLREMVTAGCTAVVMEVSSQGVDQRRVDDVPFALGVVTNLAPLEHMEYHPTYDHYAAAKARFVAMIPPHGGVLMHEGEAAARLGPAARAPVVHFGRGPRCALRLLDEEPVAVGRLGEGAVPWPGGADGRCGGDGHGAAAGDGVGTPGAALHGAGSSPWMNRLRLALPAMWPPLPAVRGPEPPRPAVHGSGPASGHGPVPAPPVVGVDTRLLGSHHALNVVAAVGAALWLGIHPDLVARAVPAFPAPPRRTEVLMQYPFTVIDDTAGRPDSLAACFKVASRIPHRRLVAVFAVRGRRGEALNYANGLQLACEARRLRAQLIITASLEVTGPDDAVQPAEWEACLAGLEAGGLRSSDVETHARLDDAIAAAVARLREGDLLLLLGAQGMDPGAAVLQRILARTRVTPLPARAGGPAGHARSSAVARPVL
ncbi:UDP-N-acetylmuramyl-tripeptide synthetase [Thermaerobacter marianensis DSM 12885]|uniref:UDP-N-acetylmuramyl-tripeptide synthetase n=1 Tax=Thermaerobacter marianensis (strain ATCC 700841 / DSM 12885 / JCM 10246 / 7p75a) TaxID=644966 RepID=E6SJ34_THEM7|nr:Mur ligase family protein [Thermaerobacter marianensis]ADU52058.1 UDP-N-acetylmuramyl-tripeptide synthetase [Thermaerobacter marianensis DSM 12885]